MSAPKVSHVFQSTLPDGNNSGLLQPSHWNADHVVDIPGYQYISYTLVGYWDGSAWDATTQGVINSLLLAGIAETQILVQNTGGQQGSFTIPGASLQPLVAAPSLTGVQQGGFTLPGLSSQPAVSVLSLSGLSGGGFTLPGVPCQPAVAVPILAGVEAATESGSFAMPSATLRPSVVVPTLTVLIAGSFAMPEVSCRPVVVAPLTQELPTATVVFSNLYEPQPQVDPESTIIFSNFNS